MAVTAVSRYSPITAEEFERRVGRPPEDDDLERVNCREPGMDGHRWCGWNEGAGLPVFIAGD